MDATTQEINEIIKKNLPAQVGDVLKQRLAQADAYESDVKHLTGVKVSNEATIIGLESKIKEYEQFDNRNAALDAREKELDNKERNLKIAELEFKLANEKEKTQFSQSVAMGLVRNIEYRKSIFDSETQSPFIDANGTWQYPQPTSKNHEENKTAQ